MGHLATAEMMDAQSHASRKKRGFVHRKETHILKRTEDMGSKRQKAPFDPEGIYIIF